MDTVVASLLIRQHLRLIDEGVGPRDPHPSDRDVLADAVAVAGHLFPHAELCDANLGCPQARCAGAPAQPHQPRHLAA